ncbi:lantibiotic dehydratase [Nonomuraea sp. NPDC050556]|uniref:lantibiotic dehydratase n=1 Tax=Nonomuraea sp. NPDC050556 TaxID=3364369 RepID=UPI0037B2F4B5
MTGGSALLRVAGLPVRLWLEASAPRLFELLRALERSEQAYRRRAAALGERLGDEVVPRPDLTPGDRRAVLAIRRTLHRGNPLSDGQARRLCDLAREQDGFVREAAEVVRLSAELVRLEELAEAGVAEEHGRLLAAPWHLLHSVRGGRACADPGVLADIERRLAAAEPWTSKRMRRRSDYLWRMIARGAAKSTPRSWLGQVALVPLTGPGTGLSVNGQVAVEWTENVHARRQEAARTGSGTLSLTPLHRVEGDRLAVWTVDAGHRLLSYRLRRTPTVDEVIAGRVPTGPSEVVGRLVELGVLEASAPLRQQRGRWDRTAGQAVEGPRTARQAVAGNGFVDVYRRVEGALNADLATLQHAFEQYRRIALLIDQDQPPTSTPLRERITPTSRPVMDVFAEEMAAWRDEGRARRPRSWPPAHDPDSGYAKLLATMDGSRPIDLTAETLDAVGAPQAPLTWPVDLVVRQLPKGGWVLDNLGPAAVLDARFVETLHRLHGTVPMADAYRTFLTELDRLTGVPSVELLIPPLSEGAANAVRRPKYTRAWTGDPDPRHYGTAWRTGKARHLPLSELTAHREAGRIVISHEGSPVRICAHATRNPLPPWTILAALLCADSPQRAAHGRSLRCSLTAFPDRPFVPRITVAGSLVVSAAQWRVPASRLDGIREGGLAGLRALGRLRDELGLPRWVFVAGPDGTRPLACDLESVRAPQVFPQEEQVTVAEMLPGPGELSVPEHAAELLIRLPYATEPQEMAAIAAQASAGST